MLSLAFFNDPLILFLTGITLLILFFWYFATEIEDRKRNIGTGLLIGVVILCSLAIFPPKEKLKGGIDIVGGSAFKILLQPKIDPNGTAMPITPDQVEEAIRIIRQRLDPAGQKDLMATREGENGILVQMPGVSPEISAEIRTTLEKVAKLELKEVHPETDKLLPIGKTLAQAVLDGDEIMPGYEVYKFVDKQKEGETTRYILLNRKTALEGNDVAYAEASMQSQDAIDIRLTGDGEDKMIALTSPMTPDRDRIAVVLDGVVLSAPVVQQVPLGKIFVINGIDNSAERKSLSSALMNPLVNPIKVDQERIVSPTLGAAFVKQGIFSAIAGLLLTAVFIFIYYRTAGIIALFALLVNGIMLFGIMAMFGFAFSLPGIAGLVLTIGMAVDANVIIYERLREEIANGKSLKSAIAASYEKAFSSIFDANLTTLIACVILIAMASGSVKGFAITLTVGLVASMFSAILVTRVLFRWGIDTSLIRKVSFLNLVKGSEYDFMGKVKACAIFSAILFAISLGTFAVKREKAFSIDFTGGTIITFALNDATVSLEDVEKTLKNTPLKGEAVPQLQNIVGSGNLLTIRANDQDGETIVKTLREQIPLLGEKDAEGKYTYSASPETVSATLGKSFLKEALFAIALGVVGIFIYIVFRFELSFAIGAIVAVLHDLLIAVGLVVLFGEQLSQIHVAAILTIAGYSINDTIIIFDRIRETVLLRSGDVKEVMNEAINTTLSRTILTSATTIFTVVVLAIFGGAALRDFSVTILVGLIVGTYSSIYIASPIALWWSQRKGGNLRKDVLTTMLAGETTTQS